MISRKKWKKSKRSSKKLMTKRLMPEQKKKNLKKFRKSSKEKKVKSRGQFNKILVFMSEGWSYALILWD